MTLRILQFGASGQLARELLDRAARHDVSITALSRDDVDLADLGALERAVATAGPVDLVVIAAAYTAVDRAETEPDLAHRINGEAPGVIASACAARGLPVVHVSTDYVFPGDKAGAWAEDDVTGPLNVYGASKLAGERAVAAANDRSLILRTSWVFSAYGANFVKTMRRLAALGDPLRVVDDQHGRPTAAGDLADFILAAAPRLVGSTDGYGLYHFAGHGETSWRGFAEAVVGLCPPPRPEVLPIRTADRPSPAARPLNSVLDTTRLEAAYGVRLRPWADGLAEVMARLA